MKRRAFMSTAGAGGLAIGAAIASAETSDKTRPLSQWQWRACEVGSELEEALKRVLCRCDIGRGRGTAVPAPQAHNVFHVWVDMDDEMVLAAKHKFSEIPDDFQSRCYVVSIPIQCILMYTEDDLVESLQKAMSVAKKRPQVRRWKQRFVPDYYDNMVNLADYLPDMNDRSPMVGDARRGAGRGRG